MQIQTDFSCGLISNGLLAFLRTFRMTPDCSRGNRHRILNATVKQVTLREESITASKVLDVPSRYRGSVSRKRWAGFAFLQRDDIGAERLQSSDKLTWENSEQTFDAIAGQSCRRQISIYERRYAAG